MSGMGLFAVVAGATLVATGAGCTQVLGWEECSDERPCPAGYTCEANACVAGSAERPTVDVSGVIDRDTEWTSENTYILKDTVFVAPGAKLTIKSGTIIKGEQASAIVVQNGGRIEARGTKTEPVVFTSARPVGQRAPADWGGVGLLGRAPVNVADAIFEAVEPEDGEYGGADPAWSCGVLQFVRIEYAGYPILAEAEHNGLTLAGCGSQTLIDHVQIHMSGDDGVQILGGTVNLKHIVMTQVVKDGLDWEYGWRGRAQFVVIQQGGDQENAFESVNNDDEPDVEPRSEPTIYNFTLIGSGGEGGNQRAIFMEAGAGGHFHNGLVVGQTLEGVDILGAETVANLTKEPAVLEITHTAFFDVGVGGTHYFPTLTDESGDEEDDDGFDEDAFFRKVEAGNVFGADPRLPDPYNLDAPGWVPPAGILPGVARLPTVEFDQAGQYLGAFQPGAAAWTDGWTAFPPN